MNFATAYDPFRALQASFELLKKAPATVLVGGVLLTIMDGGCSGGNQINIDGSHEFDGVETAVIVVLALAVIGIAIAFWLFGCLLKVGFPTAIENVRSTEREDVGAMFQSEGRWGNMVLATLLQAVVGFMATVPLILVVLIAVFTASEAGGGGLAAGIGIGAVLIWLPFFVYVLLGISLVPMGVSLERLGPVAAFERSWSLVAGNRWRLFLYYLVTTVFSMLGLLACCIGVFVTSSLTYAANADAYLNLVRATDARPEFFE